jgi:hypothetical protein
MRVLLVDHDCCNPPTTRVHRYRAQLAQQGIEALICGPAEASHGLPAGGLHHIDLQDMAAASPLLLHQLREGTAQAFLQATGDLPGHLLGVVRETARQTLAAAVDALDPDVIFVLHAGILADLAVETGAPVAVHVAHSDVARYRHTPPTQARELVAAALASAELVIAADQATAQELRQHWLDDTLSLPIWPLEDGAGKPIAAACRTALQRRRG